MASKDGSIVLVYNGEIYNHLELKIELEALGYNVAERPYVMRDVPRCTLQEVDPNVTMLYAVLRKDTNV